jgi:hypothetical protein
MKSCVVTEELRRFQAPLGVRTLCKPNVWSPQAVTSSAYRPETAFDAEQAAKVAVPTLLLVGGNSTEAYGAFRWAHSTKGFV